MGRILLTTLSVVVTMVLSCGATPADQPAAPADLLLILDGSGSMWGQIDGENKIVIARRALGEILDQLPPDQQMSLVAYGHRKKGDCEDIEQILPMAAHEAVSLKKTIESINPTGKTPITGALEHAFASLKPGSGDTTIVLVTDGLETCGGDPCARVRLARKEGLSFIMHVVGFDVGNEDVSQLECAAQAGGGLYLDAENAAGLSDALEAAVAMPASLPSGALKLKGIVDGELFDVAVHLRRADSGEDAGGGRTYAKPSTNPRRVPLPPGRYDVTVQAIGLKGDVQRRFSINIEGDQVIEKTVDFSSGELEVAVTRDGAKTDATISVFVAGTNQRVAGGRTYQGDSRNPKRIRLTAGTYDVSVKSVEIKNAEPQRADRVVIAPGGIAESKFAFESGTLMLGVSRKGALIDATVKLTNVETGRSAAAGRTYASEKTNPKTFILSPGTYAVNVHEIRGVRTQLQVTLAAGQTVEKIVELD